MSDGANNLYAQTSTYLSNEVPTLIVSQLMGRQVLLKTLIERIFFLTDGADKVSYLVFVPFTFGDDCFGVKNLYRTVVVLDKF